MAETVFDVINDTSIPVADRPHVARLRRVLLDDEVLNVLDRVQESSNTDLYFALQDTLDDVNMTSDFSSYDSFSQVPWGILKMGAILNILVSQGILSARNQLTFNDAGGIQVSDMDKYGRYINWFNVLIIKYQRAVISWKIFKNADKCYGGVGSEYGDYGDI